MQIHVYDHAQQVGQAAATLLAAQLISKPNSVLGLATGSTPIPTYQALISLYKAGVVDFSSASSFNLDEYVGLPAGHPCSYHSFMREQLFDHVNMPADHIHIPDGNAADPQTECARYDQAITAAGGIDMQVLGIGRNGHIGFNEPADDFTYGTHVVTLAADTIEANARFFKSADEVPRQAVSMGIGNIMAAKCVVLVATGENKAKAVYDTIRGPITPRVPASVLQLHPCCVILTDREAGKLMLEE